MNNCLRWTDVNDIAMLLAEQHAEVDPKYLKFPDLYRWVLALPAFSDDPSRCNERVLEAIQGAWLSEIS